MAECVVLPGLYGLFVQGLLFLCCVGVLIFKKVREGAQRTWFEFCLDSSKQFIGAGWIHVTNLVCATALGSRMSKGDECEWYWINIMIDTTLGVAVEYWLLRQITRTLQACLADGASDYHSGEYWIGDEFQLRRYVKQLMVWLLVVTLMKLVMVLLILLCQVPLVAIASFLLAPFVQRPWTKLLVVMILTPLCMNVFQFWVVDSFIQKQRASHSCHGENSNEMSSVSPTSLAGERHPLLSPGSDALS
mmetsp:Transcript_122358/g.357165  ORF Transcript_122358/g.357165 Transcript_122358/m.357165 type:complete len:247 (+) Transcript_122358:87-827(+)